MRNKECKEGKRKVDTFQSRILPEVPVIVHLEVTYQCNQSCIYCYNPWRSTGTANKELSTKDWKHIIRNLGENKVLRCVFTGGEPLLRKDITDLLVTACDYDWFVHLNTNGALFHLRQDVIQVLKAYKISPLISFLGLASHNRISRTDACKVILKNLKMLLIKGVRPNVNIVVLDQSKSEIEDTIKFLQDLGITRIYLSRALPCVSASCPIFAPLSKAEEIYELMVKYDCFAASPLPLCAVKDKFQEYKRLPGSGCTAGFFVCAISPSGRIKGCVHSSKEFGNVLELGIKEAYRSCEAYREKMLMSIPSKCQKCGKLLECKAICPETINTLGGDPWIGEPFPQEEVTESFSYRPEEEKFLLHTIFVKANDIKYRLEKFGSIVIKWRRVLPLNLLFTEIFLEFTKPTKSIDILLKKRIDKEELLDAVAFLHVLGIIQQVKKTKISSVKSDF